MEKKLQYLRKRYTNHPIRYQVIQQKEDGFTEVRSGQVKVVDISYVFDDTIVVVLNIGQQSYLSTFELRQRLIQVFHNYFNLRTHFRLDNTL
jgi:hypothetical protein